jgi:hypothetical protein
MLPLHNYFAVLLAHHPDAHDLPVFLLSYPTQLQMLTTDSTWNVTVLQYHTLFFNRLSREMEASGDYSAWRDPDIDLLCTHVYLYRRSSHSVSSLPFDNGPHSQEDFFFNTHCDIMARSPRRAHRGRCRRRSLPLPFEPVSASPCEDPA